jgi:hypothetical protein
VTPNRAPSEPPVAAPCGCSKGAASRLSP